LFEILGGIVAVFATVSTFFHARCERRDGATSWVHHIVAMTQLYRADGARNRLQRMS
jgi:hypothetical protein